MRVGVRVGWWLVAAWLLGSCAADDDGGSPQTMAGAPAVGTPAPFGGAPGAGGIGGASAGMGGALGMTPVGTAGAAGSVAPFDAGPPSTPDAGVAPDAGRLPPASDAAIVDSGDPPDAAVPPDTGAPDEGAGGRGEEPPLSPVYRIALRLHRGDSGLSDDALRDVLDETNWIWWSQAAICFEIEIVDGDQTMSSGFDFWFHRSEIPCSPGANGVFCGDHDIHSLDDPSLGAVDNDEWDTEHDPSRTSAHELGHGLSLDHYNGFPDSNDSLMSSGRQGFKLHESEITAARNRARSKALADLTPLYCTPP
jgi:hypothetical protein